MVKRLTRWLARRADLLAVALRPQLADEVARQLTPIIRSIEKSQVEVADATREIAERQLEIAAKVRQVAGQHALQNNMPSLLAEMSLRKTAIHSPAQADESFALHVRNGIRVHAGMLPLGDSTPARAELLTELVFLWRNASLVRPLFDLLRERRVLFSGQAYYNTWYLSRALRQQGWRADVLNWDGNPASQMHYHGEDYRFVGSTEQEITASLSFYVQSLYRYDVFHFSNSHGISFGTQVANLVGDALGPAGEILLLKSLGKKIVYSNNGCHDGVSQTMFSRWGPESVCAVCRWRDEPTVCSDDRNLQWGAFRNSVTDYQCTLGGNRVDYNDSPLVHEAPGFYCLDPDIWKPGLEIPAAFRLERRPGQLWLYHAIGNRTERTRDNGVNIKSSHVWLPMLDKFRAAGWDLGLLEPDGVPNMEVRYLQAQSDIFLEMLTFGWFGANAREAMMLGKPVICFIRPEWLETVRLELPEYAANLPVVSATPQTAEGVLFDLMSNPAKRQEIGRRSREFMIRWHSPAAGAREFDHIYRKLLQGEPLHGTQDSGTTSAQPVPASQT